MKRITVLLALFAAGTLWAQSQSVTFRTVTNGQGYITYQWPNPDVDPDGLQKGEAGLRGPTGGSNGIKNVELQVVAAGEQSITIQGSNDGASWYTMHAITLVDGEYFPLTGLTTSGFYTIIEDPQFMRPVVTNVAGASTVNMVVIIGADAN